MKEGENLDSYETLEKTRRMGVEARARVRLLQGIEQTHDELKQNGDYPQLYVGLMTGVLLTAYYSLPANPVSQDLSLIGSVAGYFLAIILIPIVLVFAVVIISLFALILGMIVSPLLIFIFKLLAKLWIGIRDWFIPLERSSLDDLQHFSEHLTWPAAREENNPQ